MSAKSDLIAQVQIAIDAIAAVKVSAEALPEGDSQVEELQKKIEDLSAQLANMAVQLDAAKATIASEEAALQADEAKIAKLKEILLA